MSFDKFEWLKAVYADPRFPAGEKAVLAYVTVFSVLYGEDSFRVRQSTLADAAHSGISRQTVGSAIRRAKRHGYLAVVSPHAPGRTHHTAEMLQLLLPAKSKASLHDSDEEPALPAKSTDALHHSDGRNHVKQTAKSGKANGGNHVKQTADSGKAANAPTSQNDTPIRSLISSSISSLQGSGEETPKNLSPQQEPRTAPNGASLDGKKPRPQLGSVVGRMMKKTNPDRVLRAVPTPQRNDVLREENERFQERRDGIKACPDCDDEHGYRLDDDTQQCWHGKETPA